MQPKARGSGAGGIVNVFHCERASTVVGCGPLAPPQQIATSRWKSKSMLFCGRSRGERRGTHRGSRKFVCCSDGAMWRPSAPREASDARTPPLRRPPARRTACAFRLVPRGACRRQERKLSAVLVVQGCGGSNRNDRAASRHSNPDCERKCAEAICGAGTARTPPLRRPLMLWTACAGRPVPRGACRRAELKGERSAGSPRVWRQQQEQEGIVTALQPRWRDACEMISPSVPDPNQGRNPHHHPTHPALGGCYWSRGRAP